MLCKLQSVGRSFLQFGFFLILILDVAAIGWVPTVTAQATSPGSGTISGTVRLKATNRPASQVAVTLKSRVAGIFRSVLTDMEGHFEVRSLPLSTYEIAVDEPGYEPAQASAQLEGPSSELLLYLNSPGVVQAPRSNYSVSARELRISGKARREYEKGLVSLEKKEFAEGVSHLTKAAQEFPEYYEAFYHIGVAQTRRGRFEEAMQAFQKAVDLSGGRFAEAEFGIGYLQYLKGRSEEAVTIVRRGLDVERSSPGGYLILALAQLKLNRLDEAEKSVQEALQRDPNSAEAYLVLSNVYGCRREYFAQLQGLNAYLKLQPNGAESPGVRQARDAVQVLLARAHAEN